MSNENPKKSLNYTGFYNIDDIKNISTLIEYEYKMMLYYSNYRYFTFQNFDRNVKKKIASISFNIKGCQSRCKSLVPLSRGRQGT